MTAPNDGSGERPIGNGWTSAQEWVKRELDTLSDGQTALNTKMDRSHAELGAKIDRLIWWMLSQTVVVVLAVFVELMRRHM
jgi:hypothetical protein